MYVGVSFGIAFCKREPRGDSGLEGYQLGDEYAFRRMESDDPNESPYYRVFPSFGNDYYETCSVPTFKKYFQEGQNA